MVNHLVILNMTNNHLMICCRSHYYLSCSVLCGPRNVHTMIKLKKKFKFMQPQNTKSAGLLGDLRSRIVSFFKNSNNY